MEVVYSYLNNSIDRTGFLAEATVDTLGHVNVVACSSPAAISSSLSLNGNGLGSTEAVKERKRKEDSCELIAV